MPSTQYAGQINRMVTAHPSLSNALHRRLLERRNELAGYIATLGTVQDWGDYQYRLGVIAGLDEAITFCQEAEKDLGE
jgi:hypothetical protein